MYENYTLEGPNHADYLLLVAEKPELAKSLYNTETNMYEGPETLAERGLSYEGFLEANKANELSSTESTETVNESTESSSEVESDGSTEESTDTAE